MATLNDYITDENAGADFQGPWLHPDYVHSIEVAFVNLAGSPIDCQVYVEYTNQNPPEAGVELSGSRITVSGDTRVLLRPAEPMRVQFARLVYKSNGVSAGQVSAYIDGLDKV